MFMNNIVNRFIRSRLVVFILCWIVVRSYKVNGQTFYQCMACPAGTYQDGNECRSCPDGRYSEVGSSYCKECPYKYRVNDDRNGCEKLSCAYGYIPSYGKCEKRCKENEYYEAYFNRCRSLNEEDKKADLKPGYYKLKIGKHIKYLKCPGNQYYCPNGIDFLACWDKQYWSNGNHEYTDCSVVSKAYVLYSYDVKNNKIVRSKYFKRTGFYDYITCYPPSNYKDEESVFCFPYNLFYFFRDYYHEPGQTIDLHVPKSRGSFSAYIDNESSRGLDILYNLSPYKDIFCDIKITNKDQDNFTISVKCPGKEEKTYNHKYSELKIMID